MANRSNQLGNVDINKKGQVTIFVIIAIVIVGVIVLVFVFPKVNVFAGEVNPNSYLSDCIKPSLDEIKETLSNQGGYAEPTNYLMYKGDRIQFLCYTSENYLPCVVQQPLLVRHVEGEVKDYIQPRARQCISDLKTRYERQGYNVQSTPGEVNVSIDSGSITVDFVSPMVVSKQDNAQTFRKFAVALDSEWYDLLSTATSIIQYESTFGDSETSLYISYYPNLKIDKTRRDEGTVYKLSDVVTGDEFSFASRSLVWPQGLS